MPRAPLPTHLHLGEEPVDAGHRVEEDVRGQIVPDLEAAQDVRRPVPHAAGDGAGRVLGGGARRLGGAAELELLLHGAVQLLEEGQHVGVHDRLRGHHDGGGVGGHCYCC